MLALATPAEARKRAKGKAKATAVKSEVARKAPPSDPAATIALGKAWTAYRDGDFAAALALAEPLLTTATLRNPDYPLYLAGEAAFLLGDRQKALPLFERLAHMKTSRFAAGAAWRVADCTWDLGRTADARRAYEKLLRSPDGDVGVAHFRIAEAAATVGEQRLAATTWRKLALTDPAHPLATVALERLAAAGEPPLTARERITRAANLTAGRAWPEALVELAFVGDDQPAAILRLRDFWTGETLFKMRRQYGRAGELLISVYDQMGGMAAQALFHGARALSRADRDDEGIKWYREVVRLYPKTEWAAEAQFLTGWLEYNRRDFRAAIPGFEGLLAKYPKSKWADDALWFQGYCHYLLGEYDVALPLLERLTKYGGELDGGKGRYWKARTLIAQGNEADGVAELRALVTRYPFSWYALLARARLAERGVTVGPFGDAATKASAKGAGGPAFGKLDEALAADPAIARVDELIAAGLGTEAGFELRRVEGALLAKYKAKRALPILMDRYTRAGTWARPYALAEGYGGGAWRRQPEGVSRVWWEYAYPLAYREFVDRYQASAANPPYYLYAIMRKESGFKPHDVSYADAIGLLQMIPPTTRRVAPKVGLEYADDLLYDPELNVKVGAWYIGNLAQKFKLQIPIAAGSFNSGPRPVMKWLDRFGDRPIDEFVELVAFRETREYMKKVAGIYARYLYLYEGTDYLQPLTIDRDYIKNDLDY